MAADESPSHEKGQSGIVQAALSGMCPRCHKPTLFEAPARIAMKCDACDLDFTALERGARLAGVVTILTAAILICIALGIDIAFDPPIWLQALIWGPLTIASVIGVLRFYKTLLLYRQYEAATEKENR